MRGGSNLDPAHGALEAATRIDSRDARRRCYFTALLPARRPGSEHEAPPIAIDSPAMGDKTKWAGPRYRQPDTQLRVWGIRCPEIDEKTGRVREDQPGDYGAAFEVHIGASADRTYAVDGSDVDRDLFMAMLEIAKVRQLKRIARALEKTAGLQHDEPEDPLDPMKPKET